MPLSVGRSVSSNVCQRGVPQSAALDYCLNKLWNEVPSLQRKQELTGSGALRPPNSFWCDAKRPQRRNRGLEILVKKKRGACSSLTMTTSMWNLLGQMHSEWQRFIFPSPAQCFHPKRGGGWNMLTQANEREGKRRSTKRQIRRGSRKVV